MQVNSASSYEGLAELKQSQGFIEHAVQYGNTRPISSLCQDNKKEFIATVLLRYYILPRKALLDQLAEGLSCLLLLLLLLLLLFFFSSYQPNSQK